MSYPTRPHEHGQEDARLECSTLPRQRLAIQRLRPPESPGSENSGQAILRPRTMCPPLPRATKQSIERTSATPPSPPRNQPQSAETEIAAVLLWPRLRTGSPTDTPAENLRIQRSKVREAAQRVVLAAQGGR